MKEAGGGRGGKEGRRSAGKQEQQLVGISGCPWSKVQREEGGVAPQAHKGKEGDLCCRKRSLTRSRKGGRRREGRGKNRVSEKTKRGGMNEGRGRPARGKMALKDDEDSKG